MRRRRSKRLFVNLSGKQDSYWTQLWKASASSIADTHGDTLFHEGNSQVLKTETCQVKGMSLSFFIFI